MCAFKRNFLLYHTKILHFLSHNIFYECMIQWRNLMPDFLQMNFPSWIKHCSGQHFCLLEFDLNIIKRENETEIYTILRICSGLCLIKQLRIKNWVKTDGCFFCSDLSHVCLEDLELNFRQLILWAQFEVITDKSK